MPPDPTALTDYLYTKMQPNRKVNFKENELALALESQETFEYLALVKARVVTISKWNSFLSAALSVIQLKIQDGPAASQSNKLLLGVAWQYVRQGQKNCTFSWVEGRSLSSILNSEGDVYYEIHRETKSTKHSVRQYPVKIQTRERFFLKL